MFLPLTVNEAGSDIQFNNEESRHCMYFVNDMRKKGDVFKGEDKPKVFLFIEVNDVNPLNALSFQLENGKYLWDAVVLFAANINYDAASGRPYVKCNPNVQYLLDNNETLIQPLRKRGIKVILGILGNHDMAGVAQLSPQGCKDFAHELARYCYAYDLDGVNFDDEWSDPNVDVNNPSFTFPSYEAGARLCLETKRAMPDKLVTVFCWANMHHLDQVDGVDAKEYTDIAVANYSSTAPALGQMTLKQCSGVSSEYNLHRGDDLDANKAEWLMSNGYGWFMGFAPFPNNYTDIWNRLEGAEVLYGSPLKEPSLFYKKNATEPSVTVGLKDDDFSFAATTLPEMSYELGVVANVTGYKIAEMAYEAKVVIKKETFTIVTSFDGANDNSATFERTVGKRLRDSILSPFFHSYIFAMYKNEALWI